MIELLLKAENALALGMLDQAERVYWQAIEHDPRNAIAIVGLSRVALERGDEWTAMDFATRALAVDPDNATARRLIVRLTEVIGRRGDGPRGLPARPTARTAAELPGQPLAAANLVMPGAPANAAQTARPPEASPLAEGPMPAEALASADEPAPDEARASAEAPPAAGAQPPIPPSPQPVSPAPGRRGIMARLFRRS